MKWRKEPKEQLLKEAREKIDDATELIESAVTMVY